MSVQGFFRLSLALPIALPLALFPFGTNVVSALLYLALVFGGIQYLIFAIFIFYYIGKLRTEQQIRRLSYWAPVLFVFVQALGWILWAGYQWRLDPQMTEIFAPLLPFSIYSIIIGYIYVGLVNFLYIFFRWQGWVNENSTP